MLETSIKNIALYSKFYTKIEITLSMMAAIDVGVEMEKLRKACVLD